MSHELTAEQIAWFDQTWAAGSDNLDRLIDAYIAARAGDEKENVSEPVTIVALAMHLTNAFERDHLAGALTHSIVRLARRHG